MPDEIYFKTVEGQGKSSANGASGTGVVYESVSGIGVASMADPRGQIQQQEENDDE